jgi:hypothetical protein
MSMWYPCAARPPENRRQKPMTAQIKPRFKLGLQVAASIAVLL